MDKIDQHLKQLIKYNRVLARTTSKKEYEETIVKALKDMAKMIGENENGVFIDDRGDICWESGPFEWTLEFTGEENFYGIIGNTNKKFGCEPATSYSMTVFEL